MNLEEKTEEEITELITGKKITFIRKIATAEETVHVRSSVSVYTEGSGERCVRFVSPEGWRFIGLADIIKIGKKTYNKEN